MGTHFDEEDIARLMRQMVAEAKGREAIANENCDRLLQVLAEYQIFETRAWLDLVDEVVILAFVAVSGIEQVTDCESMTFSQVTWMFAVTESAALRRSARECQEMQDAARLAHASFLSQVHDWLGMSGKALGQLPDTEHRKIAGLAIHRFRKSLTVERATREAHCQLILACFKLMYAVQAEDAGVASDFDLEECVLEVCSYLRRITLLPEFVPPQNTYSDCTFVAYAGLECCPSCHKYGAIWLCETNSATARRSSDFFLLCSMCKDVFAADTTTVAETLEDAKHLATPDTVSDIWNMLDQCFIEAAAKSIAESSQQFDSAKLEVANKKILNAVKSSATAVCATHDRTHVNYVLKRYLVFRDWPVEEI